MSNIRYESILLYLGPPTLSKELLELLHPQFFIPCIVRDNLIKEFDQHANPVRDMDVYLPNAAVDLINLLYDPRYPRRHFHLYCETEELVQHYERTIQIDNCKVFNANEIEEKLNETAARHLLLSTIYLNNRARSEDVDDLRLQMGELLVQSTERINENIRRVSGLPQQPSEDEDI
jgi:hypothetical protein